MYLNPSYWICFSGEPDWYPYAEKALAAPGRRHDLGQGVICSWYSPKGANS